MINYKAPKPLDYSSYLQKIHPEWGEHAIKTITFQVTEDCCLKCTYCYQGHKTKKQMSYETIHPFLYDLLHDNIPSICTNNTKGIIIEFIGGEPLVEFNLIKQIFEYVKTTYPNEDCIFYATTDEIHQIFVPGRACTFVDMLIDLSGAIVGILFIHLILKRWEKQKD